VCVCVCVCRRLRVRFNTRVTVHELQDLDEERRSQWMYVAARRLQFQRRIRQTAIILEPVLTEEHRLLMLLRTMRLSD